LGGQAPPGVLRRARLCMASVCVALYTRPQLLHLGFGADMEKKQ
jgi:hypothetical protein